MIRLNYFCRFTVIFAGLLLLLFLSSASYGATIVRNHVPLSHWDYSTDTEYSQFEDAPHGSVILTGFVINHDDVINGITPVFRQISNNGNLGREIMGTQHGSNSGEEITLERLGHVVVGIEVFEGPYQDTDCIKQITVIYQRWDNGCTTGPEIRSETLGIGPDLEGGGHYSAIAGEYGQLPVGIYGLEANYILRLSFITAHLSRCHVSPPRPQD